MIFPDAFDSLLKFEELLEATKLVGESELLASEKSLSGLEFESLVYEWMCEVSVGTDFENKIVRTKDVEFPDIIVNQVYGVEVKLTKSNKWTSVGNSILETNRVHSVEDIYILFAKIGGVPEIKYKSYEKCISSVGVTHSPRYKINMDLVDTFFDELGIDYHEFRNSSNQIETVRNFYRKKRKVEEHLWWIDQDKDINMVMKNFNKLSKQEKEDILTQSFVEHPEIFNSDYSGVNAMFVNMGIICSNTRDIFSAGGQRKIEGKDRPAVLKRFYDNLVSIKNQLKNIEDWLLSISDKEIRETLKTWLNKP